MGIKWSMTRVPESLSDVLEDLKEDPDEGKWKPVAQKILESDPEIKEEIRRKDPDLLRELGETDDLFPGEKTDKFSIF